MSRIRRSRWMNWPTACLPPAPTRYGCMRGKPGWRASAPKENRDIPPLDYARVYRLKQRLADQFIGINGGIASLDEAIAHLEPRRRRDAWPRCVPYTRLPGRNRPARLRAACRAGRLHSVVRHDGRLMPLATSHRADGSATSPGIWSACFTAGPARGASVRSCRPTRRARERGPKSSAPHSPRSAVEADARAA